MPRLMHDMTRYRLSDETFRTIKSSGRTNLNYVDISHFGKQESTSDEHSLQNLLINFLVEANERRGSGAGAAAAAPK